MRVCSVWDVFFGRSTMDWLQFFSTIISAVAWPIALIFVVYKFSGPLSKLITQVSRLKHGDTEIEFNRTLEKAAEIARRNDVTVSAPIESINNNLFSLMRRDPRSAVIEGWLSIELEIKRIVEDFGGNFRSPRDGVMYLKSKGIIGNGLDEIILILSRSRNEAAHSPDFSPSESDILLFLRLQKSAIERLRQITPDRFSATTQIPTKMS